MKTLQKTLLILLSSSLLFAASYEYPFLYKDTRTMGMGGANIASGGEASTIFSNPAGLYALKQEEGMELEVLNATLALSGGFLAFASDLQKNAALLSTDIEAFITAMTQYRKSNFHISANDYSSVSFRGDRLAISIGALAGAEFNLIPHLSLGADGLIEVNARTMTGVILGLSYDVSESFHLGLGYKLLQGYNKAATLKLVSVASINDFMANPTERLADYNTTALDLGMVYNLSGMFEFLEGLDPIVGVSILNIGGISMGSYYASIPQTMNVGIALKPDFPFLSDWRFAMDYIDVLNAYDSIGLDANMMKRIRLGFSASLVNNSIVQLTASAGAYNLAPTLGLQARLAMFEIDLAMYSEEIGAYATQNVDQRFQFSFIMGF